jgi:hypothetical protein
MSVSVKRGDWPRSLWWIEKPSFFKGFTSVVDVSGLIRHDPKRFRPEADLAMLKEDGRMLVIDFKRSYRRVLEDERADAEPQQERLFDPAT